MILNVYKDKLSQALTIGHTLMAALKGKLTPAEFKNIYPSPEDKLKSLLDWTSGATQTNVPRAISVSYVAALIQHMEQDSDSMCSSEDDMPKSTQGPNWRDISTTNFPKPGGVSTKYPKE